MLLPFLTTMVNTSLMQGQLPASQKHAIVTPRLKRSGLDPTDITNFRPVSNMTFMSKVVERAAASHLNAYLSVNGLLPRQQSAYRQKHSTETAMLRVWSDILTSADVREVTLLGLFDLSAAFDCVNHGILLQRLEVVFTVRSRGHGSQMDLLVPDRSTAAGLLPWMPVVNAVRTVRRAARVGAWPTAVCALHRRAGADRRAPQPTSTHVRRRLPGVPQHVR